MKDLWQPFCRFDYNKYMVGVDLADQFNGYYLTMHKARNYFWRRVFEQKLMQACTNAWLLFKWWLDDIIGKVKAEIKTLEDAGHVEGGTTAESVLLGRLKKELQHLKKLHKKTRAQWMRALATYLMSRSHEGCAARGGRRKRGGVPAFRRARDRLEHYRRLPGRTRKHCASPNCTGSATPRAGPVKRQRSARVSHACFCESCEAVGGVAICTVCHGCDDSHAAAYARVASRKYRAARNATGPAPGEETSGDDGEE